MRVVSARASFSPQGAAWRTWAFTIAHNLAMDRLRTSGREVDVPAQDDTSDDPLEWIAATMDMSHPSSEDTAFFRSSHFDVLLLAEIESPMEPERSMTRNTLGCTRVTVNC